MALSGTVNTSSYDGRYYQLSWTATQSIANNSSTISWTLKALGGSSSWYAERTLTVYIGGIKVYSKENRVERYTGTIKTGTITLTHNSAGAKSFDVSVNAAVYGTTVNCKGSGSFTLNNIARASTLAASNGTLGTAQTLTVTRQSTSFTHTITYKCGSATGTVVTKSSSTSISFTPPLSLASQNTTGTSVSVTLTITTYNGSTSIGTATKTITCSIPASVKPSCSITVTDTQGYKSTYGKAIKGLSKFKIVVSPTISYNSAIASYKITANGETYTTAPATTDLLKYSGSLSITAQVTDKRGRKGTAEVIENVYDYSPPYISKLNVNRCNGDGSENEQGAYIKATISGGMTSLDGQNFAQYTLRYKKTAVNAYTTIPAEILAEDGITGSVTDGEYIFEADTESSYDVIVDITDNFQTVSRVTSASTAYTIIDFKANGKGIGFGKVSEMDNVVDFGFIIRTMGGILQPVLEAGTNFDNVTIPNTYTLKNANAANYTNCPITTGTGTLTVESCGDVGQLKQTVVVCHKTNPLKYERFYYQNSWGAWKRNFPVSLYSDSSGSTGIITLSESITNFEYIEIFFTDNNNKIGGYTKVYSANGKTLCLSIIEAASSAQTYFRRTAYTVSETALTPDTTTAGFTRINTATPSHTTGSNYIKITKVVGHE